jgi:hypothetical protein
MTEEEIKAATVRFTKMGGQGVLIPNRLILTAAHCIEWSGDGRMVMGDDIIEEIETKDGRTLRVTATTVDPVSDIAAMCGLDNQACYNDSERFDEFCDDTAAIPLSTTRPELFAEFPIRILTHKCEWICGTGQFCNETGSSMFIKAKAQIEGGTSGGPVVDAAGNLIGVISFASETIPKRTECDGSIAFACRALPVWLIDDLNKQAED